MALFALVCPNENPSLAQTLQATFPNDHLKIGGGQWLVALHGTARELSDALGISKGTLGTVIVLTISAYWGNAPNDVWEWMSSRQGRP